MFLSKKLIYLDKLIIYEMRGKSEENFHFQDRQKVAKDIPNQTSENFHLHFQKVIN